MIWYTLIQFGVTVLLQQFTYVAKLYHDNGIMLTVFNVLIVFSIFCVGIISDRRPYASTLEYLRLIILTPFTIMAFIELDQVSGIYLK